MRERCRGTGFTREPLAPPGIARPLRWKRLERDGASKPRVLRGIDHAHAATADLFDDSVCANLLPDQRFSIVEDQIGGDGPCRLLEEFLRAVVAGEQRLDFPEEIGIAGGDLGEKGSALGPLAVERTVEGVGDLPPALRRHACGLPSSSRASQALATVQ
jgi:hypothetical protein